MTLIKQKNNLYPIQHLVKITNADNDIKSISLYFENGTIVKFIFDSAGDLYNAFNKLEGALLTNENVIIDEEWLGAKQSNCNI